MRALADQQAEDRLVFSLPSSEHSRLQWQLLLRQRQPAELAVTEALLVVAVQVARVLVAKRKRAMLALEA